MNEEPLPLESVDPGSAALDSVSVDDVREAFAASDPLVRHHAGDVSLALAEQSAEQMESFVPVLCDALDDESVVVVQKAAAALVPLAERQPAVFEGHLPPLVDLYSHEISTARAYAAKLLGTLAVEQPSLLGPHASELVDVLVSNSEQNGEVAEGTTGAPVDAPLHEAMAQHDNAELKRTQASQETVANAVVAVAEAHPNAVANALETIADSLSETQTTVRAALIDAIAAVAEADATAPRGCVSALDSQLTHDHPMVRARAIKALGFVGETSMEPALRRVAANDDDEDVRSLARETADYLQAH